MRTIVWFLYFWISLLFYIPAMRRAKRLTAEGRLEERDALVARKVTQWMSSLLRLAGVRAQVDGRENLPGTPCVFVSNHQGNFDIPLLLCNLDRPHGLVAKIELARLPFISTWMRYLGCVFIDRKNARKSAAAMNEAAQNLRDGRSMIVFPEGTRSRGDRVGEFKSGAFKIAYKTGAPIVPVCIDGSYRAMEANGMWVRPASVRIRVLAPIETAGLSKEEFRALDAEVRERIIEAKRQP